jgi:hypothetical protein
LMSCAYAAVCPICRNICLAAFEIIPYLYFLVAAVNAKLGFVGL